MHPILEIAIGVALGMTVFIVIVWVLGMAIYVCCNKNDCIAACKKTKSFKANKNQKIYVPPSLEQNNIVSTEPEMLPVEDKTPDCGSIKEQ